jgi:DNA-binding MarR family transcriptional regulator
VPGPPAPEVWRALVDVYQPVLREVVTELERDAGIDSGTYSVLAYLDRAHGVLPLAELQGLMRVRYSQPGLSRLVQRMESDGLVTRAGDPHDRRATTVALTRAGRARTRAARAVYDRALEHHLGAHVGADDARRLVGLLERVAARRRAAGARSGPTEITGAAP